MLRGEQMGRGRREGKGHGLMLQGSPQSLPQSSVLHSSPGHQPILEGTREGKGHSVQQPLDPPSGALSFCSQLIPQQLLPLAAKLLRPVPTFQSCCIWVFTAEPYSHLELVPPVGVSQGHMPVLRGTGRVPRSLSQASKPRTPCSGQGWGSA